MEIKEAYWHLLGRISTGKDIATFTDIIDEHDVSTLLKPLLLQGGFVIDPDSQKFRPKEMTLSLDAPWIYVRPDTFGHCNLWHKIMFSALKIFPPECLKCWKVVVRPRTLKELLKLLEVQENHTMLSCKCGVEERQYVDALYGGYFYNSSREQADDTFREVRALVDEYISPDVPVILKRYCTEFEMEFGPTDKFEISDEHIRLAQLVDSVFDIKKEDKTQPEFVKLYIMRRWFHYAEDNRDHTGREFNGGIPIYPRADSVTYEIKKEETE